MIAGEILVVVCALTSALACLLFWVLSVRERRFFARTLAELRQINAEWRDETAAFWVAVESGRPRNEPPA